MENSTPLPPKAAPGSFAAELCAILTSFAALHPLLAALLQPLLDHLRRIGESLDNLFATLRAGTPPPTATPAEPPRATSAPSRRHQPRQRVSRPRVSANRASPVPLPVHRQPPCAGSGPPLPRLAPPSARPKCFFAFFAPPRPRQTHALFVT